VDKLIPQLIADGKLATSFWVFVAFLGLLLVGVTVVVRVYKWFVDEIQSVVVSNQRAIVDKVDGVMESLESHKIEEISWQRSVDERLAGIEKKVDAVSRSRQNSNHRVWPEDD
jgi:hypothetical protein